MGNNHQPHYTDTDILLEKICTLEQRETIHLRRRMAWKEQEKELNAALQGMTRELAVLSGVLNGLVNIK